MAKKTVIITHGGQTIEINHKGKSGQLDNWMFSLNVERFLYKRYPDRFGLQITARNAHTQEEICIRRYQRSYHIPAPNTLLNEACGALQSLITAIENKDSVWDAREQT